ncbi:transglutaminase-like domain-containing protein [Eubacterium sp. MSJ-33]|uniref:transglutaminase-like domain-containing protein n=1 Tax=Eubacterium sp. MSJ-33 TaxID=2841528 RepID=UPI001C77674D|nr:transglutaminase-like domain-containing protein [Eubacterium sp. MSJ-33]QWT54081.1 transglutaminase-like domain-containing protein [Eubacterium sp. MSJ-33]
MAKKKGADTIEPMELCEGVYLQEEFFEKKENRVLTLLLKGFIVYLLSMGSIGFYLTAFNISFHVVLCHVLILLTSLGCAMLYYRLLVENLGYLFLFVTFAFLVFTFRDYINSGFYAVVNITVDNAAQYFDVDIQRLYEEKIGNRYVTVTFVALFIGIVLDILLNVYISRRMQYVTAFVIIMSLNVIPLYLTMEPDLLYVLMMLAGVSMAIIFKAGKHYSPQVAVKRSSARFCVQGKKKKEVAYVYDVKAMLQAGVLAVVSAILVTTMAGSFRPKDTFNVGYTGNKYKKLTMAAMSTLLVDGFEGLYHRTGTNGGVGGGKLGDVSTVYLDNQTDLVVKLAPYTSNRIYLKSFTGVRYNPYANEWTPMSEIKEYDGMDMNAEARSLKEQYEKNAADGAKATMEIQCVGVYPQVYQPYYTDDVGTIRNGYTITYYPRVGNNRASVDYQTKAYTDADLYVPEENMDAVSEVATELGTIGKTEDVIASLKKYFDDNYPYTIRPGKTPKKKDFINYFLTENKKGYCSYFASAAVLIFRYMGIPTRYVEGYAIDYEQILSGELVDGADYADYYDGYSEIGETAYVQVNVTDADAHAWVEVYDPVIGWYPVDVTPSSDEKEDITNFWDEFADFMGDSESGSDTITENGNALTIPDNLMQNIVYGLVAIAALFVVFLFGRRFVIWLLFYIRFAKASYNDKLVLYYSRIVQRYGKRHKEFATCKNYENQILYMLAQMTAGEKKTELEAHVDEVIETLNIAGFSNQTVEETTYKKTREYLKKLRRAVRK